ncbi:MAG: CHAT domain-containing protein [Acidobacteria bacterium]|nr:CHAT domain-containing protein [Acidobacteriota bacterium]
MGFRTILIAILSLMLASLPAHIRERRADVPLDERVTWIGELARKNEWRRILEAAPAMAEVAERKGDFRTASGLNYYVSQAHIGLFDCGKALSAATKTRSLALQAKAWGAVSVANYALAHIYGQLGNYRDAEQTGREMLAQAARLDPKRTRKLEMHSLMGAILRQTGKVEESKQQYRFAIDEADARADLPSKADALEQVSIGMMKDGDLATAEAYLIESYRIRRIHSPSYLGHSFRYLGRLRQLQGRPREALRFFDMALASPTIALFPFQVHYLKAQTQILLNDWPSALGGLRVAVGQIRDLRMHLPFGDQLRISSEASVQDVFSLLSDMTAEKAIEGRSQQLVEESFIAALENRAASLRARSGARESWSKKLPEEYWRTLDRLRTMQLRGSADELQKLRRRLTEMEASAIQEGDRIIDSAPSLPAIRRTMLPRELLIAFHVGEKRGWRWTLTQTTLEVRLMPDRATLAAQVDLFNKRIAEGSQEASIVGNALFRSLLGDIPQLDDSHLITVIPDDTLFELPFSALVTHWEGERAVYLIENHAVRLAPTAIIPSKRRESRSRGFLGVGDPVANRADPRWRAALPWWRRLLPLPPNPLESPRLVGSNAELERCRRYWLNDEAMLLVGIDVSRERIVDALQRHPFALHFATHVVRLNSDREPPVIFLGLSQKGTPEILNDVDIPASMQPVPRFVTLSGCGSGRGTLAPGTGLLGLTRAWLLTGAEGVLATLWSVVDDSGGMFEEYYRVLRQEMPAADSRTAAEALRKAQLGAIGRGGAGAHPYAWGAYFVIGVL